MFKSWHCIVYSLYVVTMSDVGVAVLLMRARISLGRRISPHTGVLDADRKKYSGCKEHTHTPRPRNQHKKRKKKGEQGKNIFIFKEKIWGKNAPKNNTNSIERPERGRKNTPESRLRPIMPFFPSNYSLFFIKA